MVNDKLIVIGIDGGDLKVINPLIKEGKLPNIQRIIEKSSSGVLQSSILPSSEQAWSSFSSGCNNGKHGIYSFIQRDKRSYKFRMVDGSFFKGKRLWDVLGDYGKRSIVINVTATYPPKKINGVIVTCRLTPGKNVEYTYPSDIKKDIEKIAADYIIRVPRFKGPKEDVKKVQNYVTEVEKKIAEQGGITKHLIRNYPWDLLILVFDYTDDIQHVFWSDFFEKNEYKDIIPKVYKKIDEEIGEIVSEVGKNSNVMLMSDHGFTSLKRRINFNMWLKKNGYLVDNQEKVSSIRRKIMKSVHKMMPSIIEERIRRNPFFGEIFSSAVYSNINWEKTKAFAVGSGGICINLKGRELKGSVDKSDYDDIRDEIVKKLRKLVDPETGKPAIKKVFKREEVYNGPYLEDAPDIVNLLVDGYKADLFRTKGEVFCDEGIATGNHSLYGFLAVTGNNIRTKKHKKIFKIVDLAPTILHLMKIPAPKYMDGRVLKEIFKK